MAGGILAARRHKRHKILRRRKDSDGKKVPDTFAMRSLVNRYNLFI